MCNFRMLTIIFLVLQSTACTSPDKPVIISNNGCYIDSVEPVNIENKEAFEVKSDKILNVRGWVADIPNSLSPKSMVLVLMDGQQKGYNIGTTSDFSMRPDVAKVFNNPQIAHSGFSFKATVSDVPAGQYTALINVDFGNIRHICKSATPWTVTR